LNAIVEYLSAGIILFLILGFTSQYATNMIYDKINLIEKNAGFEKADKIIDMILLSPGKPENWSMSAGDPDSLGLSLADAVKSYQLDSGKVIRLSDMSDKYIPPYRVRDLIGLSTYYYISLEIFPLFNISVTNSSNIFSVKILNQWNIPVSNVNITAAYSNIENITSNDIVLFMDNNLRDAVYQYNMTDALGTCELNFSSVGGRKSLIILASQMDVKSATTWPTLSKDLIGTIVSSMGTSSNYNVETVYKNVEINGLSYIVRFSIWSS
jgi:hypothetical protein